MDINGWHYSRHALPKSLLLADNPDALAPDSNNGNNRAVLSAVKYDLHCLIIYRSDMKGLPTKDLIIAFVMEDLEKLN